MAEQQEVLVLRAVALYGQGQVEDLRDQGGPGGEG